MVGVRRLSGAIAVDGVLSSETTGTGEQSVRSGRHGKAGRTGSRPSGNRSEHERRAGDELGIECVEQFGGAGDL